MSQYQSALQLAKKGFHVFPLYPNSKEPVIAKFPVLASRDPEQIKNWWVDPVLEIERDYNVGISTSKYGDDETLVVVDVDNKEGRNGDEELLKLELAGGEIPDTLEQTTPTGGRHLIYRSKELFKNGTHVLAKGLDIRGKGGYIVGAGSKIDGKEYSINEKNIAEINTWLAERIKRHTPKADQPKKKTDVKINDNTAKIRAIDYLKTEAPIAVEGEGGDETTYKVACRLKDFGIVEADAVDLLMFAWNPRCQPPWDADEIKAKVKNAYKYGTEEIGAGAPEVEFQKVEEEEEKSYLQKLNERYAIVYMEGSHFILDETIDEKGEKKRAFLSEPTFKRRLSPFTIQGGGRGKPLTFADVWLDWEKRREYAGVCFAPEREPRHNYYNLWRGFTVKPIAPAEATAEQKQGLQMFLDHALENVCQGDKKLFNWLMGYFAHTIQKPYVRPLTTIVFKGRKGTGKNALIDRFGRLLGRSHYLVAHDGRYLTSNFNGHMDSCLMLVLDEAFWSGDKNAEGKLKGITTAPEIMIERKGKEPYTVDNLVRLVVIGNEDWLVPASNDERRYAVFQMGEGKKQQNEFFETMRILLDEKGGCQLLLHYFQNFDLSTVDVNKAPQTKALLEQKLLSADPVEQWWLESLEEGRLVGSDFIHSWLPQVAKDEVRNAFNRYCKSRNIKSRIPADNEFGRLLRRSCPSAVNAKKRGENETYIYEYKFPTLEQARKEYETYIGHEVTWNE